MRAFVTTVRRTTPGHAGISGACCCIALLKSSGSPIPTAGLRPSAGRRGARQERGCGWCVALCGAVERIESSREFPILFFKQVAEGSEATHAGNRDYIED